MFIGGKYCYPGITVLGVERAMQERPHLPLMSPVRLLLLQEDLLVEEMRPLLLRRMVHSSRR